MAKHDRTQHDFFGEPGCLGLDHQNGVFRAGDDQLEIGVFERRTPRIQQVLAMREAHFRSTNRTRKRHTRNGQCRRSADHRRNVRIDVRVQRYDCRNDLDLVLEALGEERPYRPVDEAAYQRLFLAGTTFALEEATGDLARGIGLFLIINGQREEVPARIRCLAAHCRNEYHGFRHIDDDGTVGLACNGPGLQGDNVLAVLERFLD